MDIYALTTQEILDTISRHCPGALSVYLKCINFADGDGNVFFSKPQVEIDMSEDWRSFKNNIKKLARENLLEWHPIDNGISVVLAAIDNG